MKMLPSLSHTAVVLTLTILPLIVGSSVGAASHPKLTARTKASHSRPAAQGTRLFATGAVNRDTSTVKAISADNRFTFVNLTPTTIIIQGGKSVTPDAITEGNKLLCQGIWVDDAWGPVFQAKRIEIIGSIGDIALQAKVAAACQRAAQDSSGGAGGSGFSQADDSGMVDRQKQALQDYTDAYQSKYDAQDDARQALFNEFDKAKGLGYDPDSERDFVKAAQDFNTTLDRLESISPVPASMSKTNDLVKQGCSAYREWSRLLSQHYRRAAAGYDNEYLMKDRIKKSAEAAKLFDQAFAEFKHGVDDTVR